MNFQIGAVKESDFIVEDLNFVKLDDNNWKLIKVSSKEEYPEMFRELGITSIQEISISYDRSMK